MPKVKFGLPSGFAQLMTMAPATQITMPATTRLVGFCFKKIHAKIAPNRLQVADMGMA